MDVSRTLIAGADRPYDHQVGNLSEIKQLKHVGRVGEPSQTTASEPEAHTRPNILAVPVAGINNRRGRGINRFELLRDPSYRWLVRNVRHGAVYNEDTLVEKLSRYRLPTTAWRTTAENPREHTARTVAARDLITRFVDADILTRLPDGMIQRTLKELSSISKLCSQGAELTVDHLISALERDPSLCDRAPQPVLEWKNCSKKHWLIDRDEMLRILVRVVLGDTLTQITGVSDRRRLRRLMEPIKRITNLTLDALRINFAHSLVAHLKTDMQQTLSTVAATQAIKMRLGTTESTLAVSDALFRVALASKYNRSDLSEIRQAFNVPEAGITEFVTSVIYQVRPQLAELRRASLLGKLEEYRPDFVRKISKHYPFVDAFQEDKALEVHAVVAAAPLQSCTPVEIFDSKSILASLQEMRKTDFERFFTTLRGLVRNRPLYQQIFHELPREEHDCVEKLGDFLQVAAETDVVFANRLLELHPINPIVAKTAYLCDRLTKLFAQLGRYDDYTSVFRIQLQRGVCAEHWGRIISSLYNGTAAFGTASIDGLWKELLSALPEGSQGLQRSFLKSYRKWRRSYVSNPTSATLVHNDHLSHEAKDCLDVESPCIRSPVPYGRELNKRLTNVQELAKQGNMSDACKLLREIIQVRCDLAEAAFRFCEKYEIPAPMSTDLLASAQMAKDVAAGEPVDTFPWYLHKADLSFYGKLQSADIWLKEANELISQGQTHLGIDIWMGIFELFPVARHFFFTNLCRLQSSMSPDDFLQALGVTERYSENQQVLILLSLVADAGARENSEVTPRLYEQLLASARGAEVRFSYSKRLLHRGEITQAVELWRTAPNTCALETLLFLQTAPKGRITATDTEQLLTKAVQEDRLACLAFVYRELTTMSKPLLAMELIARLFQHKQESLSASEKSALRLTLAHRKIANELKESLLSGLRARGAMSQFEIEILVSEVAQSGAEISTLARDEEIENYLKRKMPTLKTGRFFSELSERQPLFNPGRETSRMARSVIAKPYRMAANNTRDGIKKRDSC